MKLYINSISSYCSELENIDIKNELKQQYNSNTRRLDLFIQLGLLGAFRLKKQCVINETDELYVTSGLGNTDVISRMNKYVIREGNSIKPFDFINILGNATSYYIAKALGTKSKTLFQISDHFTYINTLIFAYASISSSGNNAIIACCDLVTQPDEAIKRVMGVGKETNIATSVNYQQVSLDKKDAIAEIEFETLSYSLQEALGLINNTGMKVVTSSRCHRLDAMKPGFFFETIASYIVNESIQKHQEVIFVDCIDDKYKILKIKSYI